MARLAPRYCAFISHRQNPDRPVAIRLARALEAFRTPRSLVAEGHPARLGVVFRDDDELSVGESLSETLQSALQRSDHLIVLCSPYTRQSEWVTREIEAFQSMDRSDHIIAVVTDGDPSEVVPPQIHRRKITEESSDVSPASHWVDGETIVADLRPREDESAATTFRKVVLKIASAILGCNYDDLVNRSELVRRAQQRRVIAATLGAFVVVVGAVWLMYSSFFATHTRYFVDYAERWGVPVGVGELNTGQQRVRTLSYRIRTRAGHVVELARVNGSGTPISLGYIWGLNIRSEAEGAGDNVVRWTYAYDGDVLSAVTSYDANGVRIQRSSYNCSTDHRECVSRFEAGLGLVSGQRNAAASLDARDPNATRSAIGQHRLLFDETGLLWERHFETIGGVRTRDSVGAFGIAYAYSPSGQITERRLLDTAGNTLVGRAGVAVVRYGYDGQNELSHIDFLDVGDHLISSEGGVASIAIERTRGNPIHVRFFDTSSNLVTSTVWRVSQWTYDYDNRGNLVERVALSVSGDPATSSSGFSKQRFEYDHHGRIISYEMYSPSDERILVPSWGFFRGRFEYDNLGRRISVSAEGIDDEPTLNRDTYAAARMTVALNRDGHQVSVRFWGVDGHLMLTSNWGCAGFDYERDSAGRILQSVCIGIDGSPTIGKYGWAAQTQRYDENGNLVEEAFYDVENQPALQTPALYSRASYAYDELGNLVERTYFDQGGSLTLNRTSGAARQTFNYDSRGLVLSIVSFDELDQRFRNLYNGCATERLEYDGAGRETRFACYDGEDRLTLSKVNGAAVTESTYDERGLVLSQALFGVNEEPVLGNDGLHRVEHRYDERGNEIEQIIWGRNNDRGYSRTIGGSGVRWIYDSRNLKIEGQVRDVGSYETGGIRCNAPTWRNEHDEMGQVIRQSYHHSDGSPFACPGGVHAIRRGFDATGNIVERLYVDVNEHPVADRDGTARLVSRYDALGRTTRVEMFGADGHPRNLASMGFARQDDEFDPRGNLIRRSFFDAEGEPFSFQGCAAMYSEYDERDRQREARCVGAQGQAVVGEWLGAAILRRTYDTPIRSTVLFLDVSERPMRTTDSGVFQVRDTTNAAGEIVRQEYLRQDGRPMRNSWGYATVETSRDVLGNIREERYFGETGRPALRTNAYVPNEELEDLLGMWRGFALGGALSPEEIESIGHGGFARIVQDVELGLGPTRRRYIGVRGEPVAGFNGFADERFERDAMGRIVSYRAVFPDGRAAPTVRITYNAAGDASMISFVDVRGRPVNGRQGIAGYRIYYNRDFTINRGEPFTAPE
ncbi:MAG: toll/interleukin-1 receptor domain-containing protein [Caulobacterales bacterium]|nr:toll/interleukin-1 receptor domain-containing protein [Caulobacterales bacterium]